MLSFQTRLSSFCPPPSCWLPLSFQTSYFLQLSLTSTQIPLCHPPPSPPQPPPAHPFFFSYKTVVMKMLRLSVVIFFTCSFPGVTHWASVQMNVSAQWMSQPPLRKSSWAQSMPRCYFCCCRACTLTLSKTQTNRKFNFQSRWLYHIWKN